MGRSLISNPPYNMKWQLPDLAQTQARFANYKLPPESNSNYAFILTALNQIDDKAALLLPTGVLSTNNANEKSIKKKLVEDNFLDAVIILPDKMFVSTSISTCILLFNKHKKNKTVEMIDLQQSYAEEQREQNGQFGGNSHEKRTYYKSFKIITDEIMEKSIECIENRKTLPGFSKAVTLDEIKSQDFILTPSRYINFDFEEKEKHRSYEDIVENINYIIKMQNACKLVINETLAKNLGLDVELYKQSKKQSADVQKTIKGLGVDIETDDYIQFTKNKNELIFKCNDKELLPDILLQFLAVWKNQIALLNTMQNQYLTELRDTLLPNLMSGKIQLPEN